MYLNVCNYILTRSHWFPHFIFCPDGGIWLFVCGLFSHQCSLRETLQQKTHHQVLCSFCSLLILFLWHISMQCILISTVFHTKKQNSHWTLHVCVLQHNLPSEQTRRARIQPLWKVHGQTPYQRSSQEGKQRITTVSYLLVICIANILSLQCELK